MDPDNPRPAHPSGMSLTTVQQWVLSVLAVTTILHLSAGLVVFAMFAPDSRPDSRLIDATSRDSADLPQRAGDRRPPRLVRFAQRCGPRAFE